MIGISLVECFLNISFSNLDGPSCVLRLGGMPDCRFTSPSKHILIMLLLPDRGQHLWPSSGRSALCLNLLFDPECAQMLAKELTCAVQRTYPTIAEWNAIQIYLCTKLIYTLLAPEYGRMFADDSAPFFPPENICSHQTVQLPLPAIPRRFKQEWTQWRDLLRILLDTLPLRDVSWNL